MTWPFDSFAPAGTGNSDYRQVLGYDPKAALWSQIAAALQQAGAGVATAPRGQAVGQGLLGVLQGTQQGQQNYESGLLNQFKWKQLADEQKQQAAARAYLQPLVGGQTVGANPVPFNTAFDTAGVTNGPAGDSGADSTASDPFADIPENVKAVARSYIESGDYDSARKTINDFRLKGGPQLPGKVGELKAAIDNGFVPPETTLDEYARIGQDPAAPIIKDFIQGNQTIQKQWNPQTRAWDVVGQGSRFAPTQPQGYEPINIKMPNGTFVTANKNNPIEVAALVKQGGVQQNPPTTTNVVNIGPNGVDYGDPGKGLVWSRNPDGTVKLDERGAPVAIPFQGGEAYQKQQEEAGKTETQNKQQTTAATIVTQDIDRATNLINSAPAWTTGYLGDWLSTIGGTTANDVRALLTTIKANAGFDRLQQMRNSSPTGGALGNVSEMELSTLQSAIGNLEQSQSKKQILENLARVKQIYSQIIDGPDSSAGSPGAGSSGNIPPPPAGFTVVQ